MKNLVIALISATFLSACAGTIEGSRYLDIEPRFDVNQFFDGPVKAWGIVQDRSGNLIQRFEVDIQGSFEDGQLVLDEKFTYGVGEGVAERIWTITETIPGEYTGGAGDIAGEAVGRAFGNAMLWAYEMDLPLDGSTVRVKFEDWIWALDQERIVNRSYIKKFGITFAEVTIFMERQ